VCSGQSAIPDQEVLEMMIIGNLDKFPLLADTYIFRAAAEVVGYVIPLAQ
jgi:hypothetical protein